MDEKVAGTGSATAAPHKPKPAAVVADEKKTITVTFEGDDIALHQAIIADAKDDERTPSLNLLRFIRKNYRQTSA